MYKLKELIADLKGINTNDPAVQKRLVKVLEQLMVVLEKNRQPISSCSCGPLE